jgi:hypothetical protein
MQDSIYADIGEKIIETLCTWLEQSSVSKKRLEIKTPPTKQRSGGKNYTVKRRVSDSDGETESDEELNIDIKEKVKRLMAEPRRKRNDLKPRARPKSKIMCFKG